MHLGDLGGTPREANEATFGYFGATLRVHPDLSDVAIVELFAMMGDAAEDGTKAVAAMRGIGDVLVHPDDVAEFWRLTKANRQTLEDVAGLATRLLAALTEHPTRRPSDSSDGPQPTATTSEDGAPLPALRLLEERGRPDLAVAVRRAQEHIA